MIELNGNLDGLSKYAGTVGGILNAIEDPRFQGDFTLWVMKGLKKHFMADTIASNLAGNYRIQHAFEWPEQDGNGVSTGQPSGIPLFKLNITGARTARIMDFTFLPSMRDVPLPDPARYGFKASKLQFLRRHRFIMKAVVMETQGSVVIAPRKSKKLFIPDASVPGGYYMTANAQTINPGGEMSTGGFAEWWSAWFAGPAKVHVDDYTMIAEDMIGSTGQKVMRYTAGTTIGGIKVGGQFARASAVQFAYRDAEVRAHSEMLRASRTVFDTDDEEWEGE